VYIYIYTYIHTYTHTHISDCVQIVHELPLLLSSNANKTFLHKSGAVRSVHRTFITMVLAWRWLGECV